MNDWLDSRPKTGPRQPARALVFETLEPRLLLSADIAPLAPAVQDASPPLPAEHRALAAAEAAPAVDFAAVSARAREVVFVDASLPDRDRLVADVFAASGGAGDVEVIFLDPARDGIAQISEALATRGGLAAIHLVTHGGEGRLDLGAATLDAAALAAHGEAIAGWAAAFAADGDLLVYGCNVAAGDAGKAFLGELARLTGAVVAASDDLTGASRLGGDWSLEFATGAIETPIGFSSGPGEWGGVLAQLDWDTVDWTAAALGPQSFAIAGGNVAIEVQLAGATPAARINNGSPDDTTNDQGGLGTAEEGLYVSSTGFQPGEGAVILIDFTHPGGVANVSFTVFDIDRGGGPNFVDEVQASFTASGAVALAIATSANNTLIAPDTVQGTASTPSNGPNSGNANATFRFTGSGITQIQLQYRNAGGATGQSITLHDFDFDVNTAPVIGGLGAVAYTENAAATLIAPAATVTDPDSADLDAGSLNVSFAANGTAADQLAIRNEGTLAGQISVSGASVSFGGVLIGTFAGGANGTDLVVAFNANATPAAAQALARNVTFANTSDDPATAARTMRVTVADGDGGSAFADATVNLTAVNDAPVNSLPAAITVTEDVATALTGLSVADLDSAAAPVAVTLAVPGGTLAATAGGGVAVAGSGTGALTLTGTTAAINAFIAGAGVTYTTALDATAAVTLTMTIDDQGNTGLGGALIDTDTMTLNVIAVNDAPTVVAPGTITVTEDVASPLAGIVVGDPDGAATVVSLALTVGSGALSATSGGGVTVAGSGTGSLALVGSVSAINAFIASGHVTFQTAPNDTAAVPLVASVNDFGNAGVGGALASAAANVALNVVPVNDAPLLGPVTLSIDPLQTVVLTGANMSATDIDDPAGALVFLVAGTANGRFELATAPGAAITRFSQAQLAAGEVRFVHTAAAFGPSFSIFVTDGRAIAGPGVAVVSFRAPGAETPPLARVEFQAGSVTAAATVLGSGAAPLAEPSAFAYLRTTPGGNDEAPLRFVAVPEVEVTGVVQARGRGASEGPLGNGDRPLLAFAEMDAIPTGVPALDFRITPLRQDEEATSPLDIALDSVRVSGMALSVGIIWWAARAGGLLASLMASAPAWRHVDPLPVLGRDDEPEIEWSDPGPQPPPDEERAASEMFAAPDGASEKAVS